MADFSILSEISNEVLKLLREQICPELIPSPESIALAAPTDKNADFQLGLYLYDLQEVREYQQVDMIRLSGGREQYPPKLLSIYYILYLNSRSQMISTPENEQRILGRAMQVLMDYAVLKGAAADGETAPSVAVQTLSFEEKTRIWSVLNVPYQLGIYFQVAPVILSSRRTREFKRVVAADFTAEQIPR